MNVMLGLILVQDQRVLKTEMGDGIVGQLVRISSINPQSRTVSLRRAPVVLCKVEYQDGRSRTAAAWRGNQGGNFVLFTVA